MADIEAYRKGMTLGLTMAEILILLLFILLLTIYTSDIIKEVPKEPGMNSQSELTAADGKPVTTRTEQPEKIQKSELTAADGKPITTRTEQPKEIQKIIRENESLKKENAKIKEENTIASELIQNTKITLSEAQQKNSDYRSENTKLRNELYESKGIDPPCWYQLTTRDNKRYERPHFLLDVAVYDYYLKIRPRETPIGRAEKDLTTYAEEYQNLQLDWLNTEKRISMQELEEIAEPIWHMGKNKQIRTYPCVFYVKVWDKTSPTAKERWKEGEDSIKQWFYTLRIKNDSW